MVAISHFTYKFSLAKLMILYKKSYKTNPKIYRLISLLPIIFSKILEKIHYVKSVRIRGYSGPYSVQMRKNTDQNNSEYGHFFT